VKDLKILSLDELLNAKDDRTEVVPVPEWGGAVKIRTLNKGEQRAILDECGSDFARIEMLMLVHGLADPQVGPEHIDILRRKSVGAVNRVINRIMVLSGLTAEARVAEQAVQEAEKSVQP